MARIQRLALFAVLSFAGIARATLEITAPVASTTIAAGKPFQFTWQDSGDSDLTPLGTLKVMVYVGSLTNQTMLATVGNFPAGKLSGSGTIPANIGPSGHYYFLRMRPSVFGSDMTSDTYSARFTLSGGTGKFSSDASEQVSGNIDDNSDSETAPTPVSASSSSTKTSSAHRRSKATSAAGNATVTSAARIAGSFGNATTGADFGIPIASATVTSLASTASTGASGATLAKPQREVWIALTTLTLVTLASLRR
ncbi:uncharacterized protein L969DRAFT_83763 [Mixia osmundae IAM 14324]|nr:uncharacterized protein L969DRAFT_83763 [Mixia osmundae IAM 14324]KEI41907.1 hypothetical protein L969DRAFT_83763 [Mixia osmundae IAM 14324]